MALDSIPTAFRRAATTYAGLPAIRLPERHLTFSEVDQASGRIASGLAALGTGKGDRVGLYCINN